MSVYIENPQLWAEQNEYSIFPLLNSIEGFAAIENGKQVGILKKTPQGFLFIDGSKDFVANSSEEVTDNPNGFTSRSFMQSLNPLEMSTLGLKNVNEIPLSNDVSGSGHSERVSDCNYWLPYAAEHYDLSRDIRDYIFVPVPGLFSDLPNTKGDSLSLKEMLRFIPDMGMQMYKTFKGQPTHIEHHNQDIRKAKGVILDSFLRPIKFNPKYYKVALLLAFDRTKDSRLVQQILNKEVNAYSVGFYYTSYVCSICGTTVGKGINLHCCDHTRLNMPTYKNTSGRLAYRKCQNAKGFECSAVNSPAFVCNIGPTVLNPKNI